MMDKETELKRLIISKGIDAKKKKEKTYFVSGTDRPIKSMLDGLDTEEKMIFLAHISDQFYTVREVKRTLGRHHHTLARIFMKQFKKRHKYFPYSKIKEIEEKYGGMLK